MTVVAVWFTQRDLVLVDEKYGLTEQMGYNKWDLTGIQAAICYDVILFLWIKIWFNRT